MSSFLALLVEDEPEKRRLVAQVLTAAGVGHENLIVAGDAVAAKRELSQRRFDILLLDINIPIRADGEPTNDGGLAVLRWLRNASRIKAPRLVVALTGYEDALSKVREEFDNLLVRILEFSYDSIGWQQALTACIQDLTARMLPPFATDGATYNSSLALAAALEGVELGAIRALPKHWEEISLSADHARYFVARGEMPFAFIGVSAPAPGMASAAVSVTKLINSFQPQYVAMVGICAGMKGQVRIGDAVLADPCWDWGSFKIVHSEPDKEAQLLIAPYQIRISESVRIAAVTCSEDFTFFARLHDEWGEAKPPDPPRRHIGPFASGASVVAAESFMAQIAEQHRKLLGVDMESFAASVACQQAVLPRPTFFSVKAVSDFGDGAKNDAYQRYAAYVSAHAAIEIHRRMVSRS